MEYKNLGKTGLKVSRLSLGSWITFGKQIENNIASNLMDLAYDKGVNFFDNAEIYADGESERVMGKILKDRKWSRDSYIISSKAFFGAGGKKPTQRGLSRKHLVEACEAALKRLQLDYLDLYFCHRADKETPIEETVWTMHNLIQQGKILYWGTSEWSAQEIMEAHMCAKQYNLIAPSMEQSQYNMLHRKKIEVEFAQIYKTVGLGTTVWSPLASGILTGKYNDGMPPAARLNMQELDWVKDKQLVAENLEKVRKLGIFAKEMQISLPKLAIAWCLKNENVSTVILGASKLEQLEETLSSLEVLPLLDANAMEQIEEILQNRPHSPKF